MNVHGRIIQDNHKVEATQLSSVDELINKMWSFHTMEYYYSAIKRNETLIRVTTWMNFENNMPRKEARHKKTSYYMISSI